MDPADLAYEKMISKLGSVVGDNSSLFNLTIRLRLMSFLDKKPDVKMSRLRPESAGGLLTASVQLERT
ncbi:hypothetical protein ACTXT7_005486 [Hymenolepis weldensis]